MNHLLIPDVQAKEGVSTKHLRACGNYIVEHKPDVIVQIGDFADMPSLSSYDKGKKSYENRRYEKDIAATEEAMDALLGPLVKYNRKRARQKLKQYKPRMVLTLGNHEERILRVSELEPVLEGKVTIADLGYEKHGWEVHPFLDVVEIDGVCYTHYVQNDFSAIPVGRAHLIASKCHQSYSVGHKQILDYHVSNRLASGKRIQCLIAGSFYMHDEEYKGQTNDHWRGIIHKHNVKKGEYDPLFINISNLLREYT